MIDKECKKILKSVWQNQRNTMHSFVGFIVVLSGIASSFIVSALSEAVKNEQMTDDLKHFCKINNCQANPDINHLFNWKSVLEPCKLNISWVDRDQRAKLNGMETSAQRTSVIVENINFVNSYSRIIIQTYTDGGIKKSVGGDSWRAILRGQTTLSGETTRQMAYVIDRMDGTYEITFLINKAGTYHLELLLQYSMCNGLRDPPNGWFEMGNKQGHSQPESLMRNNTDKVFKTVSLPKFEVKGSDVRMKEEGSEPCGMSTVSNKLNHADAKKLSTCRLIWRNFGYWKDIKGNIHWFPEREHEESFAESLTDKYDFLWAYGDSLCERWWYTPFRQMLCRRAFRSCDHIYTWTYADRDTGQKIPAGQKFNKTQFFSPIKKIIYDQNMTNNSILIINFGLHLITGLNIKELKDVVNSFANIILEMRREKGKFGTPKIIWKTTTCAENSKLPFSGRFFLTNQRIQLFNSYTNWKLCSIGVDIYDVYSISASYPKGSLDGLHFESEVFRPADNALAKFLAEMKQ